MLLKEIILSVLMTHTPAGDSVMSVESVHECGNDPEQALCLLEPVCEPATSPICQPPYWSTFYQSWVRVETREHAFDRYDPIAEAFALKSRELLCLDEYGRRVKDCKPVRWSYDFKRKRNRGTVRELALAGLGALLLESGAREDVQVGRGQRKKPVDKGRGRGPGWEGWLMQIIPSMVWRMAPWLSEEEREAARSSKAAREAVMQELLGKDEESLGRCAEVGLRMLSISRHVCERRSRAWYKTRGMPAPPNLGDPYWWGFGMYSYYGVGPRGAAEGCYDLNKGKTLKRVRMLEKLLATTPDVTWPKRPATVAP